MPPPLILRTVDDDLRLYDPQAEQYLLARSEEGEARRLAAAKLEEAEAEIARLKRLLGETE